MSEGDVRRHPIDYAMHPRTGIVFVLWGLLVGIGVFFRDGFDIRADGIASLLMAVGLMMFGAAMRVPAGPVRRWLVLAWLASIVLSVAFYVYMAVA